VFEAVLVDELSKDAIDAASEAGVQKHDPRRTPWGLADAAWVALYARNPEVYRRVGVNERVLRRILFDVIAQVFPAEESPLARYSPEADE
jgi:hypothetical protein